MVLCTRYASAPAVKFCAAGTATRGAVCYEEEQSVNCVCFTTSATRGGRARASATPMSVAVCGEAVARREKTVLLSVT